MGDAPACLPAFGEHTFLVISQPYTVDQKLCLNTLNTCERTNVN
jgi:hypothetical protein